MKPGILLMVRELHHGGSERQMTETALGIDRTRFQPHVAAFRVEGMRANELRSAGIPILHLPVRSFKSPSAVSCARKLAHYIRDNDIRVVHPFDIPATAYAIPVVRLLTSAVALASQRIPISAASPEFRRLLLFALRRAHGIVVNCKFLERHLVEDAGIRPERIHVCYNGLDVTRFRRTTERPGDAGRGGQKPLVLGVVTVLRPEKGLPTLLEAFAQVRAFEPNVKLLVVGSGSEQADLESKARKLDITDACTFLPSTDLVQERLQQIDVFVLPTLREGLSNSLMEAMACGCCPIASRVGGNPELIEDGVRGLLFEAGNSAELTEKLRKVISNPELRIGMAAAAHDFMHERFTREAAAERMMQVYDQLISNRPTRRERSEV